MMELDFDQLSLDPKPFEFEGATFQIRPFPQSMADSVFSAAGMVQTGEQRLKMFMHCLTGWEGVTDKNGNAIPFNDTNKKLIFDVDAGNIPAFVLIKAREFFSHKEAAEKN